MTDYQITKHSHITIALILTRSVISINLINMDLRLKQGSFSKSGVSLVRLIGDKKKKSRLMHNEKQT